MKNLGCRSCGGTQYVLYLGARQAKFGGDNVDRFTGQEQVDDVIDLRAAAGYARPPEGVICVCRHLGHLVLAYASASPMNGIAASSLRAGRTAVMTGAALVEPPPWVCRSYPYAQEVSVDGGTDR
jgi:hypothetical protein